VRTLFLLVVLANLAFFAWRNYLAPPESGTDPRPLARQIAPGSLRILTPADVAALAPAKAEPARGVAAGGASNPPASKPAGPLACLEWGPIDSADALRAVRALDPLDLGTRLSQHSSSGASSWWVFIPPQGSLQAAQKKAAELKALGVEDYYVVRDQGPETWAVSLGVYHSEAAARARLDALRGQKVHSAEVGPRASKGEELWYQVRQVDATLHDKLEQIAQGFPGTGLQECSAPPASK
jgi:SPOR domain